MLIEYAHLNVTILDLPVWPGLVTWHNLGHLRVRRLALHSKHIEYRMDRWMVDHPFPWGLVRLGSMLSQTSLGTQTSTGIHCTLTGDEAVIMKNSHYLVDNGRVWLLEICNYVLNKHCAVCECIRRHSSTKLSFYMHISNICVQTHVHARTRENVCMYCLQERNRETGRPRREQGHEREK